MFDKMKQLMEMQKKIHQMKKELEGTSFEVLSSDAVVKITMSGTQEVKEVSIQADPKVTDKAILENAVRDVYNKAIKRSQEIAAAKMKDMTGFNLPGI